MSKRFLVSIALVGVSIGYAEPKIDPVIVREEIIKKLDILHQVTGSYSKDTGNGAVKIVRDIHSNVKKKWKGKLRLSKRGLQIYDQVWATVRADRQVQNHLRKTLATPLPEDTLILTNFTAENREDRQILDPIGYFDFVLSAQMVILNELASQYEMTSMVLPFTSALNWFFANKNLEPATHFDVVSAYFWLNVTPIDRLISARLRQKKELEDPKAILDLFISDKLD